MTTTVELSENGQLPLPNGFCKKNKIQPGSSLRIVEIGNALFVTPQELPTIEELEHLVTQSGAPDREQTPEEEKMVLDLIAEYRREKKSRQ